MPRQPSDPDPADRAGDEGSGSPTSSASSAWRYVPAAVCALEAVVLAVLAVGAVVSTASDRAGAVVEAVVFLLLAAGLVAIALGVLRGASWSRGAVVTTQLVVAATAVAWGGASWATLVVLVPAVLALIGVLAGAPSASIYGTDPDA